MELNLSHTKTIGEVKQQFAICFPFLKLEFFTRPHGSGKGSPAQERLADNVKLGYIKTFLRGGKLSYQPSITVADFESRLQNEFGLPAQVFRKSGSLWLETINTDTLSLEKQNSTGEAACRPMRVNLATLFL